MSDVHAGLPEDALQIAQSVLDDLKVEANRGADGQENAVDHQEEKLLTQAAG